MNKILRNLLWVGALVIVAWIISKGSLMDRSTTQSLNYTQFVQKIEAGQVASVEISKTDAHGKFKSAANAAQPQPQEFTAELPQDPFTLGELTKLMLKNHVSGLPVVDEEGAVVGVVRCHEIICRAAEGEERPPRADIGSQRALVIAQRAIGGCRYKLEGVGLQIVDESVAVIVPRVAVVRRPPRSGVDPSTER